jgi:prepilin peptidase CpaA
MNIWMLIAVSLFLLAACWTDLRLMQIPNRLTLFFGCGGLIYQCISHDLTGLGWAAAGAAAGMLPLILMYWFGGIGGGDVKWFGAFGVWMGPALTLQLMIISIVVAGAIAVVLLMLRAPVMRAAAEKIKWPWGPHPLTVGRGAQFPFMLAVAPGFIILLGKGWGT